MFGRDKQVLPNNILLSLVKWTNCIRPYQSKNPFGIIQTGFIVLLFTENCLLSKPQSALTSHFPLGELPRELSQFLRLRYQVQTIYLPKT